MNIKIIYQQITSCIMGTKTSKEEKKKLELKKEETKKWKKFVKDKKITTPYFCAQGCVRRTSDGKGYSSPEEFLSDGGVWNDVTYTD